MATLVFLPLNKSLEAHEGSKILSVALKGQVPIRYGCGACRCGTCGVLVSGDGELSSMAENEKALLELMKLPVDGRVRLACQTRIQKGKIEVDLDFQDKYSPDEGLSDPI